MRPRPLPASRLIRDSAVRTLDDRIAEMVRAAEESGELRTAKSWGKPLDFGDGYDETPADLRIAYKVLKDAGCAPAEVQLLNDVAEMRRKLHELAPESPEAEALRLRIVETEATIALRLESIARSRSL
jgi:hypothetical protein